MVATISPGRSALLDYAAPYGEVYGQTEPVPGLVPAMLSSFPDGDRALRGAGAGRRLIAAAVSPRMAAFG